MGPHPQLLDAYESIKKAIPKPRIKAESPDRMTLDSQQIISPSSSPSRRSPTPPSPKPTTPSPPPPSSPSPSPPPPLMLPLASEDPTRPFLLRGIALPADVDTLSDATAMAELLLQHGSMKRFTGFKSPLAKRIARRLVAFVDEPWLWIDVGCVSHRLRSEKARVAVMDLIRCQHYSRGAILVLAQRVGGIRPAPIIERVRNETGIKKEME